MRGVKSSAQNGYRPLLGGDREGLRGLRGESREALTWGLVSLSLSLSLSRGLRLGLRFGLLERLLREGLRFGLEPRKLPPPAPLFFGQSRIWCPNSRQL